MTLKEFADKRVGNEKHVNYSKIINGDEPTIFGYLNKEEQNNSSISFMELITLKKETGKSSEEIKTEYFFNFIKSL